MKARDHKPARRQVRGLVEELGDLVENLGLEETSAPAEPPAEAPPGSPPPLAAPPPPSAPIWRSGPEVVTGSGASTLHVPLPPAADVEDVDEPEPLPVVPMWESAEPEPAPAWESAPAATAAAVPVAEASPASLWDHFAPELSAKPARAWSPAAAMVELEPLAPPGSHGPSVWAEPPIPFWHRRPHAFTVLTTVAAMVALAVFIFSRVDLGSTSGPARPVAHPAFVLDTLRAVSATSAAQVRGAKATTHYPASAQAIYLDVTYHDVNADDALQIVILLQPQQDGQPAVTVSDENHRNLDPGGEVAITVPAPPGGFTPGTYEVRALHDGTLEQSVTFTVDQ